MALPWSPEFEMDYVNQTSPDELRQRHHTHYALFNVRGTVRRFRPGHLAVVCEVGCGAIGGLLSAYSEGVVRLAIDPLADLYVQKFGKPAYVHDFIKAYAHQIPLRDWFVDVLFCLEALDHCQDMAHFYQSQAELARILRPKGLLFFMLPARDTQKEHDGHPCTPTLNQVRDGFARHNVVIRQHLVDREGIWLVLQKKDYEAPADVPAVPVGVQDEHGPSLRDGTAPGTP
jgi:hypothetical protein